jgi:hypothetical protein
LRLMLGLWNETISWLLKVLPSDFVSQVGSSEQFTLWTKSCLSVTHHGPSRPDGLQSIFLSSKILCGSCSILHLNRSVEFQTHERWVKVNVRVRNKFRTARLQKGKRERGKR